MGHDIDFIVLYLILQRGQGLYRVADIFLFSLIFLLFFSSPASRTSTALMAGIVV
jgi:hypothetical protein